MRDEESPQPSFADYHLVVDGEKESSSKFETTSNVQSFREEGVHSSGESRIYFDEDTTLPSGEEYMNNLEPLLYLPRDQVSPLTCVNYLNVVTYAANLFISWGVGVWGLDGILDTRWDITTKFETLVTPAQWAYYLWAPILIIEGIFAIAQLLPNYRNRPIIQAGTGYFFFYTFVLQTAWTFFFSFELFILSFISVVFALLSLLSLLLSQLSHTLNPDEGRRWRWLEYLLFQFPFYMHAGWMLLMTVDHFALLFRAYGTSPSIQVSIDILSLALMLAAGVACLIRPPFNDFIIPTVITWCFLAIASRLDQPSQEMLDIYGETAVYAIRNASFFLSGILTCCLAPCVVIWTVREFLTIRVVELD